jgi:tetratricopeptide (TPR) repeat protein
MSKSWQEPAPTAPPRPPLARGERVTRWLLLALIALATLAAFCPVFRANFVNWDDDVYVYDNPHLRAGLSRPGIAWAFTGVQGGYWIPVTWLSLLVDYQLYRLQPWGYHLSNLLLHLANALLAYLFFERTTGRPYRSAFAAALFALHPLRVESVAWVTERKDVLSVFFGLLALLAYESYARRATAWRYLPVAAALTLSLLAKPMLVTLPCLLLVLDYWPLGRWPSDRRGCFRLVLEKVPLLVLAAAISLVAWHTQEQAGAVRSLEAVSLSARLANAAVGYVRYLQMTFAPVGLAPLYPYSPADLTPEKSTAALLFLAAVTVLAAWQARQRPALLVGWLWYLGTLLPVSGLFQSGDQALADRFTYFPSLGLGLALTWAAADALEAVRCPRSWQAAAAVALLLFAAVGTAVQSTHWKDSITLWAHALEVTRHNGMAHHNLGEALEKRKQWQAALTEFDKAVAIIPNFPKVHYNRGVVLEQLNRLEEAQASLSQACALEPAYVSAHYNLGVVLFRLDRFAEAEEQFRVVLALDPSHARAALNLQQSRIAAAAADGKLRPRNE